MRNKLLISVSFIIILGCDRSMLTTINGNEQFSFANSCGSIDLKASYFTGSVIISQKFNGTGFRLRPQAFNISSRPEGYFQIKSIEVTDAKGKTVRQDTVIKEGLIMIMLKTETKEGYHGDKFIVINPGDFSTCSDQPIITETLEVKLGETLQTK